MKRAMVVLAFGVLAGLAHATSFTVKAGGGGNFTTIQACATAMAAGDSCTVFAGTYNENVSVSSGTAGNYKSFTVNGSDVVNVFSFAIGSHVKINGFHISHSAAPTTACVSLPDGSTDSFITNNVMANCGTLEIGHTSVVTDVIITGNSLAYPMSNGSDNNTGPGFDLHCNNCLIANNDISHTSDGFHFGGSNNVIRNNNFHDNLIQECGSGSDHGGNCHIDFIEAEPAIATQNNLIESNTQTNTNGSGGISGAGGHGFLTQGDICSGNCGNLIVRFNQGAHVLGGGILDDNAANSGVNPGYFNVKSYNNTWADYQESGNLFGCTNTFEFNSTGGAEVNDLFYFPGSVTNTNNYCTDSSTVASFTFRNNLAWSVGSGNCTGMHGHVYSSGTWAADPGNICADPLFTSYSSSGQGDLSLQAGSPALNAGSYLTTVASGDSGTGTSLVVTDATFFQAGNGDASVGADCVALTTVSNSVCITAVNYSTNTLTLATSLTRSVGDHVWLYSDSAGTVRLTGSAPNMGAFGSSGTTFSLTVTATNGSVSGMTTGSYASGATIGTGTETPNTGYHFVSWSSTGSAACSGSGSTCASFSITANTTVTATFAINTFTLGVTATHGSVTGSNCAPGTYNYNTPIGACTATPDAGYVFVAWSGTGSCSGVSGAGTASCPFLTSNSTLTATFTLVSANPPAAPQMLMGSITTQEMK